MCNKTCCYVIYDNMTLMKIHTIYVCFRSYPQSCQCAENGATSSTCSYFKCSCLCDIIAGECDYGCCCDPDCSSDQVTTTQRPLNWHNSVIVSTRYLVLKAWTFVSSRALRVIPLYIVTAQQTWPRLIQDCLYMENRHLREGFERHYVFIRRMPSPR